MTPLDRHWRGALHFSGGKDSLALVYMLRPQWSKLTLYHVDTGDLLPEVYEIVDMVERMVPNFVRIQTNARQSMREVGLPSDLVPTTSTAAGMAIGASKHRIIDRFSCCILNLMMPMHQRMVADRVSLVIRGTKRVDMDRLPAVSGDTQLGYELWFPLQEWSNAQVFTYLQSVNAPICRVYSHKVQAPECATCPAWWSEGRAEYLARYHPELFARYRENLAVVAAEVAPHWTALQREMGE